MKEKFDFLRTIMRRNGFVSEKEYDDAGIFDVNKVNSKSKDSLSFSRQHAMILNTVVNI